MMRFVVNQVYLYLFLVHFLLVLFLIHLLLHSSALLLVGLTPALVAKMRFVVNQVYLCLVFSTISVWRFIVLTPNFENFDCALRLVYFFVMTFVVAT